MRAVRPRPVLALLGAALVLAGTAAAHAADLDPAQAKTLAALSTHTKQIETNLKLALEAAGPGSERPPEAKARLARTRLAQPEGLLPQVRAELEKLPAEQADVAALRARLDAAEQSLRALKARLDGPASTGPASAGGTKLDYKQQKELADATYYVREAEGLAAGLEALAGEVAAAPEPDAFDHRRLRGGAAAIEKARQRADLARTRLAALPADGAGVGPVAERLTAALAGVDKAEARLKPVHQRVEALVDPARYPDLAQDLRRLQDLARMLREGPGLFESQPLRAAAVSAEAAAAGAEHERIVAAYRPLVVQQTAEGQQVSALSLYFLESRGAFRAAAAAATAALPAALDEAFAGTLRLAEQAVAEAKPAFFLEASPSS